MNKIVKIISVLMIVLMLVMVTTPVFATVDSVITDLKTEMKNNDKMTSDDAILVFGGKILSFLRNASYIIGVIVLVVLGVKYMMGSLEEKAEYKKSLIPLVVGIIIVVMATTIASFLFTSFQS